MIPSGALHKYELSFQTTRQLFLRLFPTFFSPWSSGGGDNAQGLSQFTTPLRREGEEGFSLTCIRTDDFHSGVIK